MSANLKRALLYLSREDQTAWTELNAAIKDPVEVASYLAQTFDRFRSPWLPLNIERLQTLASNCARGATAAERRCLFHLASAFVTVGRISDASQFVTTILREDAASGRDPAVRKLTRALLDSAPPKSPDSLEAQPLIQDGAAAH